jgi:hypothetical protein
VKGSTNQTLVLKKDKSFSFALDLRLMKNGIIVEKYNLEMVANIISVESRCVKFLNYP